MRKSTTKCIQASFLLFLFIVLSWFCITDDNNVHNASSRYILVPINNSSCSSSSDTEDVDYVVSIKNKSSIAIVTVVDNDSHLQNYELATQTVKCYAKINGYSYVLAVDKDYEDCKQKDMFFRRHCVVAQILPDYEVVLFIDADMGVVYPKRKLEDYLSPRIDITFYDRFYNWEVVAGSYLVKNTEFSRRLLIDFANYENYLPKAFHGTDNGGLHMFLVERMFPNELGFLQLCRKVYERSKSFKDLFAYESCTRMMMGVKTDFGKIRIMRRGTAWARDNWLTNNIWSEERDLFIHGWKRKQLLEHPNGTVDIGWKRRSKWFNPLAGSIHLDLCSPLNTTWSYHANLKGNASYIEQALQKFETQVLEENMQAVSLITTMLKKKQVVNTVTTDQNHQLVH